MMSEDGKPEDTDDADDRKIEFGSGLLGGLNGLLGMVEKLAGTAERASGSHAAPDAGEGSARGSARRPRTGSRTGSARTGDTGGSVFDNLARMAERLDAISQKGETLKKEGSFSVPSGSGSMKGVYGFTIKTGLGESRDGVKVEPFGNIHKDRSTGEVVVDEVIEPQLDIFEDEGGTTLVAEMPGVGVADIRAEPKGDILSLSAENGKKKYRKEVLLGHESTADKVSVTSNNGIVTIRCGKVDR
ncbi:MAG: hypothetical protein WCP53_16080 [Verrucomicrobiota bacterium]